MSACRSRPSPPRRERRARPSSGSSGVGGPFPGSILVRSSVRAVLGDGRSGLPAAPRSGLSSVPRSAHGRIVPVGFSGPGPGLSELEREAARRAASRGCSTASTSRSRSPVAPARRAGAGRLAVLLHEAVGHFAEAAPEGRVNLNHRLGFRVATEIFHLRDDPMAEGGAPTTRRRRRRALRGATEVVRDGRMLQLLHSRPARGPWASSPPPTGAPPRSGTRRSPACRTSSAIPERRARRRCSTAWGTGSTSTPSPTATVSASASRPR